MWYAVYSNRVMEVFVMFDALDSIFRFVVGILFLIFCLVLTAISGALEILKTVISTPPLLVFTLLGSAFIAYAAWRFSKYQKAYFEKHPERGK